MSRVLVTGASGFVGRGLLPALRAAGHTAVPTARRPAPGDGHVALDLLAESPVLPADLKGFDAVIHLAGLAHVGPGHELEARAINAGGTRKLAEVAIAAGVPRLVFVSTAQVHGTTDPGRPLTPDDPLDPADAYAASKAAGEEALADLALRGSLSVATVRPPLVYGPGAAGNVARLVAWARRGRPLPGGCRGNARSLVARANLCDLLVRLVPPRQQALETFLVRDPGDVSTGAFYAGLCEALGTRAHFLPMPRAVGAALLRAGGRRRTAEALFGDFRLDDSETRATLDWTPPLDLRAGLRALAAEAS